MFLFFVGGGECLQSGLSAELFWVPLPNVLMRYILLSFIFYSKSSLKT